jgi:hypothetical protein
MEAKMDTTINTVQGRMEAMIKANHNEMKTSQE